MIRAALIVLWTCLLTFVYLVLFLFVAGIYCTITLEGDAEMKEASRKVALPLFYCSLVVAIGTSLSGLLPGTRRRPAAPTAAGEAADGDYPLECDFPPARPIITVPIGLEEEPPPELAALGQPLAIHGPGWLASMSGLARLGTFLLGVALLAAPVAAANMFDFDLPNGARIAVVFGTLGAFLTCLVIAVSPRSRCAYQVHDEALVVADGKTIRIIPWDQIQAIVPERPLVKDLALVTRDGQEVPIKGVRGYHQLVHTLYVRVRDYLLPLMIRRANAGRMVEFGPLGVSCDALRYKGQTTPWDEVVKLLILSGSGIYQLMVYRRSGLGLWAFCRLNLQTLPNDRLLRELLPQIAPDRLLVSAQDRW
jgi:hypothetical protein